MSEADRVSFIEQRDGPAAARDFCHQGMRQYRAALAQRTEIGNHRTGYGLAYRKQLVESLLYYRNYLRRTK